MTTPMSNPAAPGGWGRPEPSVEAQAVSTRGYEKTDDQASDELLLPRHHGDGLTFKVHIRLPAHVDCHPVDRATGEGMGMRARIVVGHRLTAVPSDAETLPADGELPGLRLD